MTSTSDFQNFNQQMIDAFRVNGGKGIGPFEHAPVVLLTTIGAKSGKARTSPLVYTTDGDRVVIIASKGGAPTHPDWYHNIVANPEVTVEIGTDKYQARAVVPQGEERDRLFNQQAAQMPGFAEYQRKTTRLIPVVVLERIS